MRTHTVLLPIYHRHHLQHQRYKNIKNIKNIKQYKKYQEYLKYRKYQRYHCGASCSLNGVYCDDRWPTSGAFTHWEILMVMVMMMVMMMMMIKRHLACRSLSSWFLRLPTLPLWVVEFPLRAKWLNGFTLDPPYHLHWYWRKNKSHYYSFIGHFFLKEMNDIFYKRKWPL